MCVFPCVVAVDGHRLVMKTQHLNSLEILGRMWDLIDTKDPKKGEVTVPQTKTGKAQSKGGAKGKKK
jgi:hypothetical protein